MGETTSDTLDQADEDILTYTISDEALETAARLTAQTGPSWCYPAGFCGI
jgi:hypothetical protein